MGLELEPTELSSSTIGVLVMIKLSKAFAASIVLAAAASFVAGCSGGDGEIAIDPASTPLTAQGNDKAFTIRIVEAREEGYPLEGFSVKASPDDKEVVLACTIADANTNGKLDKGDTVTCNEGATNDLDVALAGKEVDVDLFAKVDGEDLKIGSATWMVAK